MQTVKRIAAFFMIVPMVLQLTACGSKALQRPADQEWDLGGPSASDGVLGEESGGDLRYQDDYYAFVNEEILESIQLEATDAHWDWFGELSAVTDSEMEELIRQLAEDDTVCVKGSSEQKIKDLYGCVSDMDNRDATGLGPLKPHMDKIRQAESIEAYVDALASLSREFGFSSIVGGYSIMQDKADSSQYSVYMLYADTLIGKEYLEGEGTQEYVELYLGYIKDMLCEFGMGEEEARRSTDRIEGLMRDICGATLPLEQYYDPAKVYNVYTAEELQQLYTNVDVDRMLKTLQVDGQDRYIVMDVGQAEMVNSLLVEENLEALKDYSTFVMLNDVAEYGSRAFAKLSEDMENALYGITESWGDEKIWMKLTQDLLPWDFGMIYVVEHFSQEDKEDVEAMIDLILKEYETIIRRQAWMSEATKEKAIRKLETMNVKIGYPDRWPEECIRFQVTPVSEGGSLMSNLLESMKVEMDQDLDLLGTEVDREEWDIPPQTVNAYYDPVNNEIVFPAAILQAPFYDRENSDGANMGGIGYVIAHEVSHAFDSSGALYDEYGNYNVWWTEEEMEEYERLSQSIVDYYNGYEMMGTKVNGELTLGENIADLGAAMCIAQIIGDDKEALDEAFSQMAYNWASVDTASFMMYLLNTDTHAPNKVRVNAVLSSCDAFYDVYEIRESDGMYVAPQDRVGIWR